MARTKKQLKAKLSVKIRYKQLANGNQSIYLDVYNDGKREYIFPKLYLVPETTPEAKQQNKETMNVVEALQAQTILDIKNGKAGIKTNKAKRIRLKDFMEHYKEGKEKTGKSKSIAATISHTAMHLIKYKGEKVTMAQVDKSFCKGFILYLSKAMTIGNGNDADRQSGEHKPKPMAKSTASLYYNTFVTALNEAVKDDIIQSNPNDKLKKEDRKPIQPEEPSRPYLEIEEVEALINTPCLNDAVKQAFLFACFSGLRISDVIALRWTEVVTKADNMVFVEKQQVKTKRAVSVPLNKQALQWLPEQGAARKGDKVFNLPSYFTLNYDVKQWAKQAGISKDVTFHIARHTFATTLLTLGADLYTTSKLLGHNNIRTTQIYAKVVDPKKAQAVNLMDNMFGGNK